MAVLSIETDYYCNTCVPTSDFKLIFFHAMAINGLFIYEETKPRNRNQNDWKSHIYLWSLFVTLPCLPNFISRHMQKDG